MTNPKISIIDYGVGNLYSVKKAIKLFADNVVITEEGNTILSSDAIVLPGVGSFESGMNGLKVRKLIKPIKEFFKKENYLNGIMKLSLLWKLWYLSVLRKW